MPAAVGEDRTATSIWNMEYLLYSVFAKLSALLPGIIINKPRRSLFKFKDVIQTLAQIPTLEKKEEAALPLNKL